LTREELAHVLRAAATIAGDSEILVIGSQSILGSYSNEELPEEAWMSIEADIAFLDDPGTRKADLVDGAIGELSSFHEMYSFYAQGVEVSTAILPDGWRERLIPFRRQAAEPARAFCLDPHDLVVAKLAAMREKDRRFAEALIKASLIDVQTLVQRVTMLSGASSKHRSAIEAWLATMDQVREEDPF